MKTATIDLNAFRTPGARIFTGRDRGIQVRTDSKINSIEAENDEIILIIPEDIITINPSFLEEFFWDVIIKLGKESFQKKFKFICSGKYQIEPNLETAIDRILRKSSSLI